MSSTQLIIQQQGSGVPFYLQNVNLENYACEAVMAEDGMTPIGTRYTVSGTAIIPDTQWSQVQTDLRTKSSRMTLISMPNPSIPVENLLKLEAERSDIGGPFCRLTGTQILGAGLVMVRFDINDQVAGCDTPVVAHTWTQSMSIDGAGHVTRTVNGTLRISRGASGGIVGPATNASWIGVAPYADLFRRAVIPALLGGWRRESQSFAYDIHSTALIYSFVDKQYAHDLPDGVRVGDFDFSYERNAQDAGIGHCSFSCELEGDMSLKGITGTTGNRRLVEAAVALSKTRLNANLGNVLITRMKVTERGIMSGFSIRLEIDAQVFPTTVTSGDPPTTSFYPLADMIGRSFTVTRSTTVSVDAYGPLVPIADVPTAYGMVPHYINNAVNGMNCGGEGSRMPYAEVLTITGANSYGSVVVTVVANSDGVSGMNSAFDGKYETQATNNPNEGNFVQVVSYSIAHTQVNYDSGIVRLSACYTAAPDLVFQTKKPTPMIRERVEISQANSAPTKVYRPLPTGAMLVSDDWSVSFGKFDAQGNRLFTGIYERVIAMYDLGGDTYEGFYTQNYAAWGDFRLWKSPSEFVSPTLSPLGTSASQSPTLSVFTGTIASGNDSLYPVPAQAFIS